MDYFDIHEMFLVESQSWLILHLQILCYDRYSIFSSVDMRGVAQIMARSVNPYPDACAEQEVGDYTVELKAVLRSVGQYNLRCKADSEPSFSLVANGSINVVSDSSVVQMIIPPEIDSCRNGTFTLVVRLKALSTYLSFISTLS